MLGLGRMVRVVRCLKPCVLQGKFLKKTCKLALFGLDSTGGDGIITVSKENPAPQM
jgi:hypothetical protein